MQWLTALQAGNLTAVHAQERAFFGTARALGWKLWCEADKVKVCSSQLLAANHSVHLKLDAVSSKTVALSFECCSHKKQVVAQLKWQPGCFSPTRMQ